MKLLPVLAFLMMVLVTQSYAANEAEPTINLNIQSQEMAIGEPFTISIESSLKADSVKAPQDDNYELSYAGLSQNSSFTIINGKTTSSSSFIYNYDLSAKKTGKLTIDSFSFTFKGKIYTTKPFTIRVVKAGRNQNNRRSNTDPFAQIEEFFNNRPKIPSLFLKLVPHPYSAIQNQPIIVDAYMISPDKEAFDYQLTEVSPVRSDKASLVDISDSVHANLEQTGGYYQKLIRRYVAYPIETGKIGIAPPAIVAVSPYGQLGLRSEVIIIDSSELPGSKGIAYIGDLNIKTTFPTNQLETGKAVELSMEMTGNGNLKILSNPYGDFKQEGIFLSAPTTQNKFIEFKNGKAYFKQTVKYNILAQKAGDYAFPPIILSYYPDGHEKSSIKIPAFPFTSIEPSTKEPSEYFPLKVIEPLEHFSFILYQPWAILFIILFLLLPIAGFIYGQHEEKLLNNKDYSRKFLATRRLSKYFKEASRFLEANQMKEFYLALQKGLFYFATDKLNIPNGISKNDLYSQMREKGIPLDEVANFEQIYETCSMNAYSGKLDSTSADKTLLESQQLMESKHFNL